jgi:hypothetical protein
MFSMGRRSETLPLVASGAGFGRLAPGTADASSAD